MGSVSSDKPVPDRNDPPALEAVPTPPAPAAAGDKAQEVDVWWGACSSRALLPGFLLSGLLVGVVAGVGWYLRAWRGWDSYLVRYTGYALVAAILAVQLTRWVYRVLTFNYRLTTCRLLLERNFLSSGRGEVELKRVAQVLVVRDTLERLLGVGRIRVVVDDDRLPSLVLQGVHHAEHLAVEIRRQVARVREHGEVPAAEKAHAPGPPAAGHHEGAI
jgi:hypothetical protein